MKKPKRGKPVSKAPQRALEMQLTKSLSATSYASLMARKGTPAQLAAALQVAASATNRAAAALANALSVEEYTVALPEDAPAAAAPALLPVQLLGLGGHFVAYCKPLELSTYGATPEDTKTAFAGALSILVKDTLAKGTFSQVFQCLNTLPTTA